MVHFDTGAQGHALGRPGIVAARVHDHGCTAPGQAPGQRRDVDVLTAGVDAPERRERASVL
jgi:hypothetical protein